MLDNQPFHASQLSNLKVQGLHHLHAAENRQSHIDWNGKPWWLINNKIDLLFVEGAIFMCWILDTSPWTLPLQLGGRDSMSIKWCVQPKFPGGFGYCSSFFGRFFRKSTSSNERHQQFSPLRNQQVGMSLIFWILLDLETWMFLHCSYH